MKRHVVGNHYILLSGAMAGWVENNVDPDQTHSAVFDLDLHGLFSEY